MLVLTSAISPITFRIFKLIKFFKDVVNFVSSDTHAGIVHFNDYSIILSLTT